MQTIGHYISRVRELPPKETARLVVSLLDAKVGSNLLHIHDRYLPTGNYHDIAKRGLKPIEINSAKLDLTGFDIRIVRELWRMYQNHRFDLLGSGWVNVGYHNNQPGFEGHKYKCKLPSVNKGGPFFLHETLCEKDALRAEKIWSLIHGDYEPIDWQRDFKSGYRWGARMWYKPTLLADQHGGDIKVPWELSRLQHLPRLAIAYQLLPQDRKQILLEYRNEILDFISQNPIRMGVNFMCPMDVGIRNANIALSFSLFHSFGGRFDKVFERVLCDYLIDSAKFLYKNLELSSVYRSNHYFADISGILFSASVMPDYRLRRKYLIFARNEIVKEINNQFYDEGTNREGSVAYHRLTSEMALYSLALIHYLSKRNEVEDAEKNVYEKAAKACIFMDDITRPDGCFPSMGDNDGGVFFRLSFTGELLEPDYAVMKYDNLKTYQTDMKDKLYYDENLCDGRTLVSAGAGIFHGVIFNHLYYGFEKSLVQAVYDDVRRKFCGALTEDFKIVDDEHDSELPYVNETVIDTGQLLNLDRITVKRYRSFGVVIYKSSQMYLCVNLMDNGQNGMSGHAHNDKLSIELMVGEKVVFEDPGTYVYTADEELRDQYRSIRAHNTIIVDGKEQNALNGTFSLKNETTCKLLYMTNTRLVGEVHYRDVRHIRELTIRRDQIIIKDMCNKPFSTNFECGLHTRGYGKRLRCRKGRELFV